MSKQHLYMGPRFTLVPLPAHPIGTFLIAVGSPEVQHLLRQAGGDLTGT